MHAYTVLSTMQLTQCWNNCDGSDDYYGAKSAWRETMFSRDGLIIRFRTAILDDIVDVLLLAENADVQFKDDEDDDKMLYRSSSSSSVATDVIATINRRLAYVDAQMSLQTASTGNAASFPIEHIRMLRAIFM